MIIDSQQQYYEKKEKVPGGFQKPNEREVMRQFFNKMKEKGFFKNFPTYENWEESKYPEKNPGS